MHKSTAFTLIELIIVIVLLGILAATALPKFVDFSSDAREGKSVTYVGAFKTGIALTHNKWQVSDKPSSIAIDGATLYMNNSGYPENTSSAANGITSHQECAEVWNAIVQGQTVESWGSGNCTSADYSNCDMYAIRGRDNSNAYVACRYRSVVNGEIRSFEIVYDTTDGWVGCKDFAGSENYEDGSTVPCDSADY